MRFMRDAKTGSDVLICYVIAGLLAVTVTAVLGIGSMLLILVGSLFVADVVLSDSVN